MDTDFKVGDRAQLRSGGPMMTVTDAGPDAAHPGCVQCEWFDEGGEERQDWFLREILMAA